jgi:G6PDH family F420-dependent oxidoreductase
MRIGYSLITEEHGPRDLLDHAAAAVEQGFEFLSISDHFHPWLDEQGESPFAWTVLGALAERVDVPLTTAVTCPIRRYHPAIVAQAAATTACLARGGFTLGLGTGENLNEHVVGGPWPAPSVRLEMLEEAIDVIRRLWSGDEISYRGEFFEVDRARLYTLPSEPIGLVVAAGGPEAAELAGRCGTDLVITSPSEELVRAYRDAGGAGLVRAQATLCWAEDADTAAKTMLTQWRQTTMSWDANAEIPTPAGFAEATSTARLEDVTGSQPVGPDLDPILASLQTYADAGADLLTLHNVGDPQPFLTQAAADVLDRWREQG